MTSSGMCISFSPLGVNIGYLSKHKIFHLERLYNKEKWTLGESVKHIDGILIVYSIECIADYTKSLGRSSCVLFINSLVIKTV